MTRRMSSGRSSASRPIGEVVPALFTSAVIGPNSAAAVANSASTSSSTAVSTRTATHRVPASVTCGDDPVGGCFVGAVSDRDVVTVLGEPSGRRGTDAAGTAGDDRDLLHATHASRRVAGGRDPRPQPVDVNRGGRRRGVRRGGCPRVGSSSRWPPPAAVRARCRGARPTRPVPDIDSTCASSAAMASDRSPSYDSAAARSIRIARISARATCGCGAAYRPIWPYACVTYSP